MRASIHHPLPQTVSREAAEQNLSQQLGEPVEVRVVPCPRCPRAILVLDGNADAS